MTPMKMLQKGAYILKKKINHIFSEHLDISTGLLGLTNSP